MSDRQQLEQAIAALEAQRSILGDAVVDAAIGPMRRELAALAPHEPEQQRKLVTLLFCDVADSTTMVRDLDPEDSLAIMDTGLRRLSAHVGEFGGRVTRYTGDGFTALFGHPVALENDAEMAIRAGLAVLQEAQVYAQEVEQSDGVKGYTVRVGINTGLVVIGGESEGEDTMAGAAVNLAARMESAAAPGTLLISHNTYQHVRGVFDLEPREAVAAKGFELPVPVYRVLAAKPRAFRTGSRGVEGIETRMIGRLRELELLQGAFRLAVEDGERQMVTLVGEPGLGKSRLLYEFENWMDLQPARVQLFRGRGRQDLRGTPFGLLRDLFAFRFQIRDDDPAASARAKLAAGFAAALGPGAPAERNAYILGQLLGYDCADSPHVQPMREDAKQLRDRGVMYVEQFFQAAAAQRPVVVLLEDLHWADDSSLDAVTQWVMALRDQRVFLLAAARPELYQRRPHWFEGQPFHQRLDLSPLSVRDSRALVNEVLQKVAAIPEALRELIVSNAEGNPFYVEELVKMLIEEGVVVKAEPRWRVQAERLAAVHVPPTLTAILQARLDGLPEAERAVLQQASVVGRVFWDAVLEHFARRGAHPDIAPVSERLAALRGREMVFHRDVSTFRGADEYIFKHALLRDVTYETVLKRLRHAYHELAAEWLAQVSAEQGRAAEYAALIADHFECAGRSDQAQVWLRRAADDAAARYANAEAIATYERLLPLLPDRYEQIDIRLKLAEVLRLVGRYDDAEALCRQALAQAAGDAARSARCQLMLGRFSRLRGDFAAALEWLAQARTQGKISGDQAGQGEVLREIGMTCMNRGEYADARQHLQEGLRLARLAGDRQGVARILNNLGNMARHRGDAAEARALYEQSLALCHEIGDKETMAGLFNNLGNLVRDQGDYAEARVLYEESLVLCREIGDKEGIANALCNCGFVAAEQGDHVAARASLEESLALYREIGYKQGVANALENLGVAAAVQGNHAAARSRFEESLALAREIGSKQRIVENLVGLAGIAAGRGRNMAWAAQLAGAADAARAAMGMLLESGERRIYERAVAAARAALGEEAFDAAFATGQKMTMQEAVAYALAGPENTHD